MIIMIINNLNIINDDYCYYSNSYYNDYQS